MPIATPSPVSSSHLRLGVAALWTGSLFLALAAGASAQTTHTVCAGGCAFSTVTAAIAGAAAGDTLALGAESFTEEVIVDKDLVLQGSGVTATTLIWGAGTVVTINPGVTAALTRLTVVGGHGFDGGGVHNEGTLTVDRAAIDNNFALNNGGGIWSSGDLTVINSRISLNGADPIPSPNGGGGGLHITAVGTATIRNSEITDNAARTGGGIDNLGTTTIIRTSITLNEATDFTATGGAGAGIFNEVSGEIDIRNSTVADNVSQGQGGGLFNIGEMVLTNTTVSGNEAKALDPNFLGKAGGGLYNVALLQPIVLNNVTVTNNSAGTASGAGIYNDGNLFGFAGIVTMRNTIVADQANSSDCAGLGTYTSDGYNIDSDNTCNLIGVGDQTASPLLLPLDNYGGPTMTHDLDASSPAIEMGNPLGCEADIDFDGVTDGAIPADQRGQIRVDRPSVAGLCDVGAVEFNLVTNGMLEDNVDGDRRPDGWMGRSLRNNDRIDCRPGAANNGKCSFHLRGRKGATKEFFQSIDRTGVAGDQYELVVHTATRNASPANALVAVVWFEDTATGVFNEVIMPLTGGSHDYLAFASGPATALTNYDRIEVIAIRSLMTPRGRVRVDDVSLVPY